ncbi:MAG: hypothetical protein GY814_17400 [Gammaproteobacteria bacterium]|nr:hypothetical protein [Gammaproteobacteria bacterium]
MNIFVARTSVVISMLALSGCLQTMKNTLSFGDILVPTSKSAKYKKIKTGAPLTKRLMQAEAKATNSAKKVLKVGRKMALVDKEIVRGSCWDYADTVYKRAGFSRKLPQRQTVFNGSKRRGPYADIRQIKPGDFLYYINHSYGGVEHSGIFVDWENINKKTALMLSYGGENRRSPARYRIYDLSHVYHITRPKEI